MLINTELISYTIKFSQILTVEKVVKKLVFKFSVSQDRYLQITASQYFFSYAKVQVKILKTIIFVTS